MVPHIIGHTVRWRRKTLSRKLNEALQPCMNMPSMGLKRRRQAVLPWVCGFPMSKLSNATNQVVASVMRARWDL